MSAESEKQPRRKRKAPPRRVPAIIEERERTPFMFGWGAYLSRHEREALKERIALFGGIALALVLVGLLGWGAYQDNVVKPAARAAASRVPIVQVGNVTIQTGFFKRYEHFQKTEINNQLSTVKQQVATYQANPKKNKALIAQGQGQESVLQSQIGSLATDSLNTLITNETMLQGPATLGVPVTPAVINRVMTKEAAAAGGHLHLLQFIQTTGLSTHEFQDLLVANYLQSKLQTSLAAQTPRTQTEVRASHILLPTKKKALAEKLYHEVLNGADFAKLAKSHSIDPTSGKKGGDLGYFTRTAMVAPFSKAAFAMKIGQIRLVQSQYGWHIIKVTGRKQKHLSPTEYKQAQAQSFQTWLAKEQGILHVQRFVSPAKLPGASPTAVPQIPPAQITGRQVHVPPVHIPAPSHGSKTGPVGKHAATTHKK